MGSAAKPYPIRSRNRIKFRNLLKRVLLKMIVYALFFTVAVESWAQDFDVASDASAIGNTTTSPVDPVEQLRQIVEEHTKAIASLRQEMNETVKELIRCESGVGSLHLPPGYNIHHADAIKTHHIIFERTFEETP